MNLLCIEVSYFIDLSANAHQRDGLGNQKHLYTARIINRNGQETCINNKEIKLFSLNGKETAK